MNDAGASTGAAGDRHLVRVIGTWGLAASIVNVTVGGGIFRLPGSPDVSGRLGAAAPLAYLACAVVMGLVVLCIAQAGSRITLTGGPYAYVEATFGRYVGFLVGVLLWVIGATAIPGVAGLFADAGASFAPAIGTLGGRALFIGVIFAAVAWINVRGVKQGTWLNVVLTVAKLVPLALLLVGGLATADSANLRWEHGTPAVSDLARASVILVFAYAGVESALVPSGEVRDSAHTVPRAVFLAMGLVTLLYVGLQLASQGVLGASLPGRATPLADAAGRVFGAWGVVMISAGFMISAFGYLSGMMLAVPRALFAFARDGVLPRSLAAVHPRFHTPWVAIAAQSTLCWILAVFNSFETLAIIANVSAALVYIGCAAAAWKLSRDHVTANGNGFRIPGGALVPLLAIVALLFLLSAVTVREWSVLVIVLVVASVLYLVTAKRSGMHGKGRRTA